MAAQADGSVVLAGYFKETSHGLKVPEIVKLDSKGAEVWRLQVKLRRAAVSRGSGVSLESHQSYATG